MSRTRQRRRRGEGVPSGLWEAGYKMLEAHVCFHVSACCRSNLQPAGTQGNWEKHSIQEPDPFPGSFSATFLSPQLHQETFRKQVNPDMLNASELLKMRLKDDKELLKLHLLRNQHESSRLALNLALFL
jgi:hypothetical protein